MLVLKFLRSLRRANPIWLIRSLQDPISVKRGVPEQVMCSSRMVVDPSYSNTVVVVTGLMESQSITVLLSRLGQTAKKNKKEVSKEKNI